jgi:hypothetical protein
MVLIPVLLLAVFTTCMMLYKYNTPNSDPIKTNEHPKALISEMNQSTCVCNKGREVKRNEWN